MLLSQYNTTASFHSTVSFLFPQSRNYRMRTFVTLRCLCFSFVPFLFVSLSLPRCHISHESLARVAVQISLLGFGLILRYQLKDQANDLIWRPDYLILPQACGRINPQGTEHRSSID